MVDIILYGESEGELIGFTDFSPDLLSEDVRIFSSDYQRYNHLRLETIRNKIFTHINCIYWTKSKFKSDLYIKIKEEGVPKDILVYKNIDHAPCIYEAYNDFDILDVILQMNQDGLNELVPIKILRNDVNPDILPLIINGLEDLQPLETSEVVYEVLSLGRKKKNGRVGFLPEKYVGYLFGISQTMVSRHKYIATNLSPSVRLAYLRGDIPYSKLRAIAMANLDDQSYFLENANKLNHQELESRITRKKVTSTKNETLPCKLRRKKEVYDTLQDIKKETDTFDKVKALEWVLSLREDI